MIREAYGSAFMPSVNFVKAAIWAGMVEAG